MKTEKAYQLHDLIQSLELYKKDLAQLNKVTDPSCVVFVRNLSLQHQIKSDVSSMITSYARTLLSERIKYLEKQIENL